MAKKAIQKTNSSLFNLKSEFAPAGDQPKAIEGLVRSIRAGARHQTLLGVTGSGKTFTAANVISQINKPTLVIAHNKTLAAQLAQEYREFFPDNAVHYFVSYYDYYQPEAYLPVTDTYIEKEAQINEEIERLRHASTQALLTRKDVIIVATVSCIYGLGSPVEYEKVHMKISLGMQVSRADFIRRLIDIHFDRVLSDLTPGTFRALGNAVEIMPVNERAIYRIEFGTGADSSAGTKSGTKAAETGEIIGIQKIDAITRALVDAEISVFFLFPAKHFITDKDQATRALGTIKAELENRLKEFASEGKLLEAERIKRRTSYDLALIREVGYCNGIENYSRHFSGKSAGEPPDTLLSYFPRNPDGTADFLTIIDESHVTVPQLGGMFAGDASRKKNLVEHGFRLPSACDNRPLKFDEFQARIGQTVYTSATPGKFEMEKSVAKDIDSKTGAPIGGGVVEQVIRPTGLIDPQIIIKPVIERGKKGSNKGTASSVGGAGYFPGQVADFIQEAEKAIAKGERVIATTLTKKMAEDLSEYLKEKKIKSEYLHSEIKTIERIQILTNFRKGKFDCLVGVNLLREGLDLPELALIGILDADKEGFLRSETSLIQTIGRAARNVNGRVILYADVMTGSLERAIKETERRRTLQTAYNKAHGITPKTISKAINDITDQIQSEHAKTVKSLLQFDEALFAKNPKALIKDKERQMNSAVKELDFETAAILRDEIKELEGRLENRG
jgi:excinuclease ABC subunit B